MRTAHERSGKFSKPPFSLPLPRARHLRGLSAVEFSRERGYAPLLKATEFSNHHQKTMLFVCQDRNNIDALKWRPSTA